MSSSCVPFHLQRPHINVERPLAQLCDQLASVEACVPGTQGGVREVRESRRRDAIVIVAECARDRPHPLIATHSGIPTPDIEVSLKSLFDYLPKNSRHIARIHRVFELIVDERQLVPLLHARKKKRNRIGASEPIVPTIGYRRTKDDPLPR